MYLLYHQLNLIQLSVLLVNYESDNFSTFSIYMHI